MAVRDDKEQMRELRRQGLSLREIAATVGRSESTVRNAVKDIAMPIGFYRKELKAALVQGSIVNLETTGSDSDRDDIVAFGFLQGNIINVVQRVDSTPHEFHAVVADRLSSLSHPLYAYDARFQEGFLLAKLHQPVQLVDIFDTWREQARKRGARLPNLDDLASVPRQYFGETQVLDRELGSLWLAYVKTGDKRKISAIVRHCMEDLRQALYVMMFAD